MTNTKYALIFLRVGVGLLFLVAGAKKFLAPDGIIGMLANIGFPAAAFFGWLLIIVEVLGGLMLLSGFKARLATWPLMIVIIVAILTVQLKSGMTGTLKDFVIFTSLLAVNLLSK